MTRTSTISSTTPKTFNESLALRATVMFGAAAVALAFATGAQAADKKYEKQTAVMCNDGSHATDKSGCEKNGGIRASSAKSDAAAAVQTESAKVNATGQAPNTGEPSKTPAKRDAMAK